MIPLVKHLRIVFDESKLCCRHVLAKWQLAHADRKKLLEVPSVEVSSAVSWCNMINCFYVNCKSWHQFNSFANDCRLLLQPVEDTLSTTLTNVLGATRTLSYLHVLLYKYRTWRTKVNSPVYFAPPCTQSDSIKLANSIELKTTTTFFGITYVWIVCM